MLVQVFNERLCLSKLGGENICLVVSLQYQVHSVFRNTSPIPSPAAARTKLIIQVVTEAT
jgi:hypothetical protein